MSNKAVTEHFKLLEQIQNTYRDGDYAKCEKLCKKDIQLFPQYIIALAEEHGFNLDEEIPLRTVSFDTLAKLYEKQDRYSEAIKVCEMGIKHKLPDGTKGGFEGRLEKLKRKLR